jgi:hypothetical protein
VFADVACRLPFLPGESDDLGREALMRNIGRYAAAAALCVLGACGRTKNGDLTVESPGDVDIKVKTDTIHLPKAPAINFGSKLDTVVVDKPVVKMKKDTLVVKRPTVSVKKNGG